MKDLNDWYNVSEQDVGKFSADMIENCGSWYAALKTTYPEMDWIVWRLGSVPKGYWHSISHQKKYCDWLGKKLGYKTMDDWYAVRVIDFVENHGGGLIQHFNRAICSGLSSVYPAHTWIPWKFSHMHTPGFWTNSVNQVW